MQCKRDVRAASMLPEGSKAPAALPRLRTTRTRHLGRLGSCGTETAARLQEIVACRVRPRKPLFQSFRASVLALGAAMAAAALHVYISPMLFFELLIVVALILLNGVLAMAELAVVSSRRARLQALVNREVLGARRALALASDPGRFLSTVQIGITLNGVLSGAFSGATLGQRLVQWFVAVGLSTASAEIVGVGLVVAAITYVSLIVGELVPKQIALRDPERVAVRLAPAMTLLAKVASPAVWLLDVSGRLVLRALGYGRQVEQRVTDEEIKILIAEAETAGVIEPSERAMIAGVMRLGDRPVRAVMTPRRDVDMVDLSADPATIRRALLESAHSRLPVHDGAPDDMLGVLQAKDLLEAYLRGEGPDRDVYAGLFASHRVLSAGRCGYEGRQAGEQFDASDAHGIGQANRRAGGGEDACAASAGSLQEQGHPLRGRIVAQEGRQDRRVGRQVTWHHATRKM